MCPTSLVYRRELIERSGLAETLLLSLALLEKQLSVKLQVLQALQVLSRSSGESHIYLRSFCRVIGLYLSDRLSECVRDYAAFLLFVAMNCSLILRAEGAQKICFYMSEPDPSEQMLFRCTEILWNLLDNGSREEVTKQLSNMDCVMWVYFRFLTILPVACVWRSGKIRHVSLWLQQWQCL